MYYDTEGKIDKPTWIRFNVMDFIEHYDIENADSIYEIIEDDPEATMKMGYLFWNMLLYSYDRNNDLLPLADREQRLLFKSIKRGIDNSYARYEQLVENGKKGGRPKKTTTDDSGNGASGIDYPFS